MNTDILAELTDILEQKKTAAPQTSYVASLYERGLDCILQKIGEETTELIIATKSGKQKDIIHETADLWFHILVMLAQQGLSHKDIFAELQKRLGTSGLDEYARRRDKTSYNTKN